MFIISKLSVIKGWKVSFEKRVKYYIIEFYKYYERYFISFLIKIGGF